MIHLTKQTLDLLNGEYVAEPGDGHLRDELLAKYNIKTFLIKPQDEVKERKNLEQDSTILLLSYLY